MKTNVGDKFPDSNLYIYNAGNMEKTNTYKIFDNKKIIVFGMPGAFTPTCSNYHIPSIIDQIENLKKKGMYEIFCLVVNDIHVTKAWAEHTKAIETGLKFITDPDGSLVNKLNLSFSANRKDLGVSTVLQMTLPLIMLLIIFLSNKFFVKWRY